MVWSLVRVHYSLGFVDSSNLLDYAFKYNVIDKLLPFLQYGVSESIQISIIDAFRNIGFFRFSIDTFLSCNFSSV